MYDEETSEYIGNIEDLSGAIANLTKTAATPGGISLFTDKTKTTYKSTYQLLQEISKIYDKLSDKNQADLLETIAGKRQGQVVAAMLSNFSTAEKSMVSMSKSAGNAMAEMNVIMDSIDYKFNKFKETGTGIAQNLFQQDTIKSALDVFTSFANVLDRLTKTLGLFGALSLTAGSIFGIKNVGGAKCCPHKCADSNIILMETISLSIAALCNTQA